MNRTISNILQDARGIADVCAADLAASPWMQKERAAQIAENVACSGAPSALKQGEDFLNGWVAACEAAAAAIRREPIVRKVK